MRCYNIFCFLKWILLCCTFISWDLILGEIRYTIPEELQLGAFIGNIADDLGLDVQQLAARNFRLVSTPRQRFVEVSLDNGIMFVNEKIDRELICGPSLTCVMSLEAVLENPLNLYQIEVKILDINDNAPSFAKSQIRLEISEVAAPGTRFALECAHDPDVGTNSVQTYQLVANEYFLLNTEAGMGDGKLPVLVLEKPLDREKQSTHRLLLLAKDGGVPERSGTAQINIIVEDANDNTPLFPQSVYRVSLAEDVTKGALVLQVNATDLDEGSNGEIVYSFSSHTSAKVRELFGLDSKTGEIRTKANLDYEDINVFELIIQAKDKGLNANPTYCHVVLNIIDVNDNVPEVTLTSLSSPVPEDSLPGTVVALISASDKDSGAYGQMQCKISNHLPFALDSSSKKYLRLITQERLDRESVSTYEVTITCNDGGIPPFSANKTILIEVSDRNDNTPQFAQPSLTAYVMENNKIGASILSVSALDPDLGQNGQLSYSILESQVQGESVSRFIHINAETGVIYSYRSFDYEQLKKFQVQVQAHDRGVPPLASSVSIDIIILDQNDNAPVIVHPITEYGATVRETLSRLADPGHLVAKVTATDADSGQNARLSYRIHDNNLGLFTISLETGEIWTTRRITKIDSNEQKLVIFVNDNGTPALTATMTIILSMAEGSADMFNDPGSLAESPGFNSDTSLYLVISLGIISSVFLVVLIILAVKVHESRTIFDGHKYVLGTCCCFESRNGIQKASRNLQITPNYVEVFGGDPLSQSFRYDTCSPKRDLHFPNTSTGKNNAWREIASNGEEVVLGEVKQPNADWRFSQTHRAELNSSQYREEEGVQRDIQREVQREVQCDVQCEAPRDVQCNVPHNIQHEVQRDVPCEVQRVVENEPSGARKPACARPVAIPAGRDGWTLPRTAPRMQLQMTLGPHVPGTLRSQYLIPRELHTSGARISNSSVEFIAPIVGSLHGPWAANQTRDHRGISSSSGRRPELDTQACGQIPGSPSGQRLSTQCLHSRDDHHSLREVNY
ncbi:protocadherin gamma-A11-like isoform X13 [Chiloscyllium plagiosum]|uniref:protocadherin gamma-A11-like isoform X13 n=1 Tax=Chiloscyllium plagiosum TaxID=36176 RepID=UPI001CB83169|nr:protocadherin gamma-A11-like isoform X13 [Chiloscyllium plagiosum]